jgi:hypothetical protein
LPFAYPSLFFRTSGHILSASSHNHQGCGHSFVADEAKQWVQQHSQQHLQPHHSSSSTSRPVARRLEAAPKVPIRIWVEFQGTDGLTAAGQQRLREVVGKAVAVLQKFYKVKMIFNSWVVPVHYHELYTLA